jgi:hypothetical protein
MRIISEGILNRGERGTRRALATFPAVTALRDGTLLATYRAGTTKDSDDETVEMRRSTDGGRTWGAPVIPFACVMDGRRGSLKVAYLMPLEGDRLIAATLWIDREAYPGKPLFNSDTEGCLPMAILVADSEDLGHSWSPWRAVPVPEDVGPPSLTSPVLKLPSGRLAISIETNKGYEDRSKWYQRVVYVYSEDGGRTWGAPVTVAQDPAGRFFNWDQRAGVAPDGRVVTFSWTYDRETTTYLNIRRRISRDEGATWTGPEDLGFADQASHPAILPDGRVVLAWVDRYGTRSIRARLAKGVDAPFGAETEVVLYEYQEQGKGRARDTGEMLAEMSVWSFGLPYAEALPDGDVMVVYYAGDVGCTDVRWARLGL